MDAIAYPPTLDVNGAADILKVHPKTVLGMIGDGILPAAKVGRSYVLMTEDLLTHVRQQINHQLAARTGRRVHHSSSTKSLPRRLA